MGFLEPAFWWLAPPLLALLLLVPWIVRRKPCPVGPYLLLRRASQRVPQPKPLRRPRVSDLLRALPGLLLVGALARPFTSRDRPVVVIVDRTASMGAMHGEGTRIESGMGALRRASLAIGDVLGAPPPQFAADLLAATAERDGSGHLEAAIRAVRAGGSPFAVVTDRDLGDDFSPAFASGEPVSIDNLGIAAFALDDGGRLLVRIAGESRVPSELVVEKLREGAEAVEIVAAIPLGPVRGEFRTILEDVHLLDGERLRARLPPDSNPLDDVAEIRGGALSVRILLPAEGFGDLARAFAAHPASILDRSAEAGGIVLRGPGANARSWRLELSAGVQRLVQGEVTWHGGGTQRVLGFAPPLPLRVPETGEPDEVLARIDGEPLLVRTGEALSLRVAEIGGDWAKEPSFPLLVAQIVDFVRAAAGGAGAAAAGPAFVPVPPGATLLRMGGGVSVRKLDAQAAAAWGIRVEMPGAYWFEDEAGGVGDGGFVSVLADGESRHTRAGVLAVLADAGRSASAPVEWTAELCAAAALLLLTPLAVRAGRRRAS